MKRFSDADRTYTNQSDGLTFYGYDDKETGKTTWYNEKGDIDCETLCGIGERNDDERPRRNSRRR